MPKQSLVQTWLGAIGLSTDVLQTFEAAGIVNPKDLAELEIGHYPALGVKEPGDRKKLFYLVQRVKMAVPETQENDEQVMKRDEWQHAGEKTGVEEEGGKHHDNFKPDDDDAIDKALEEQYRPLLETSFSDDLYSGSEDQSDLMSSSQEEIPSPPPSKSRASHYKQKMFFAKKQNRERLSSESDKKKKMQEEDDSSQEKTKKPGFKKNLSVLFKHKKKGTSFESSSISPSNEEEFYRKKSYNHQLDTSMSQDSSPEHKVRKSALPRMSMGPSKIEVRTAPSPRRIKAKNALNEKGKTIKIHVKKNRNSVSNHASGGALNMDNINGTFSADLTQTRVALKSDYSKDGGEKEIKTPSNIDFPRGYDDNRLRNIDNTASRNTPTSHGELSSKLNPSQRKLIEKDGTVLVARRSKRLQEKKVKELDYRRSPNDSEISNTPISSTSMCIGDIDEEELGTKNRNNTSLSTKISHQRHDSAASAGSNRSEQESVTHTVNEDYNNSFEDEEIEWPSASAPDPPSISSVSSKDSTRERHSKIPHPSSKGISRENKRLSTIPSDRTMHISPPAVLTKKELENNIEPLVDENDDDEVLSYRSTASSKNSNKSRKQNSKVRIGTRPSLSTGQLPAAQHARNHRRADDDESRVSAASVSSASVGTSRSRKSHAYDKANRAKSSPRSRTKSPPPARDPPRNTPSLDPCGSKSFDVPEPRTRVKQSNPPKKTVSGTSAGITFVQGKPKVKSWKEQVSRLRDENDELFENEHGDGRFYLDPDDEMRIRVVVRKRPMSRKERIKSDEVDVIHPLQYHSHGRIMVYQPKTKVDLTREVESLPFAFDNVFGEKRTNSDIYNDTIKSLVPGVFEGRWASVFAYGQTGSGKTFTMMGSTLTGIKAGNRNVNHDDNLGLYYLAAQDVFELASRAEFSHISVRASLFEIYAGKLFDLLNDRNPVRCLENHKGRVCFPGLSEHPVSDAEDLIHLIEEGSVNRSTGSTSANRDSSRSHAVLQLHLRTNVGRKADVEHGRLTFIDLAGSERGADTSQASRTTRLEGAEINTSLLALKEVIRALATGDSLTHVPFRGSKLTQVLKEGFVGKNSRTVMVACVAPNITNCEHTLNTLRYADRVKERNNVTGQLTAAMAAASKIEKKDVMKPSKILSVTIPPCEPCENDDEWQNDDDEDEDEIEDEDDNWLSDLDDMDAVKVPERDDDELDELNEVLSSPANNPQGTLLNTINNTALFNTIDNRPLSKKEAVAPLVSSHRLIMTEMLGMVKQEMTLVNDTDADRALIDEYLNELEQIQDKQLSMISTLRNSLVEYYAVRPENRTVNTSLVSDNSFDDLRSLGN